MTLPKNGKKLSQTEAESIESAVKDAFVQFIQKRWKHLLT